MFGISNQCFPPREALEFATPALRRDREVTISTNVKRDGCGVVDTSKWIFPKIGVPQNGCFIMANPIKMDDLGVPLFLETPK